MEIFGIYILKQFCETHKPLCGSRVNAKTQGYIQHRHCQGLCSLKGAESCRILLDLERFSSRSLMHARKKFGHI